MSRQRRARSPPNWWSTAAAARQSWLRDWGFAPPAEEKVTVGVAYTSAYFKRDASVTPEIAGIIGAATPDQPYPAVLIAQEPDATGQARWVACVGGYGGDHAEPTLAAMLQRAQQIGCREIADLAQHGEPIGPVLRYAYPYSIRRRYERLARFPAGLLAMGDALTSFNPICGQGMTVAACEALELRKAIDAGLDGAAGRFFRAAAKVIDVPWQLAVGSDLSLPMVEGARPLPVRLVNAYIARLRRAAVRDAVVAKAFLQVIHMIAPPLTLFAPSVLARVLRFGGRQRVAPANLSESRVQAEQVQA